MMRKFQLLCVSLLLAAGIQSASAFALLGPFAPWMLPIPGYVTNTFISTPPVIGGPMNIGQGYRWNIPTITYAYDQSFLNFFGTNGVAAVEAAIQILNELPPASGINPTNFPFQTDHENFKIPSNIIDLKSGTLPLLLQQLGLSSPTRSLFCLNSNFNLSLPDQSINLRNFDPVTLSPSISINGNAYAYNGAENALSFPNDILTEDFINNFSTIYIYTTNFDVSTFTAVADGIAFVTPGCYSTGLTSDDVGGLKYLLSTNNIALESVLPGVSGIGTNSSNFVNRAQRPGVDKITFKRLQIDPLIGLSLPVTNLYTDTYVSNGVFQQQSLQRVITQPDIIFSVKYLADCNLGLPVEVSATQAWVNNGISGQDGPGVIQPPIKISFNASSQGAFSEGPESRIYPFLSFGSYDATSHSPIVYPIGTNQSPATTLHLWLSFDSYSTKEIKTWSLNGSAKTLFHLQSSTNLTTWTDLTVISNVGYDATFIQGSYLNSYSQQFFRVVEQ